MNAREHWPLIGVAITRLHVRYKEISRNGANTESRPLSR
jgi:hypothetical protein